MREVFTLASEHQAASIYYHDQEKLCLASVNYPETWAPRGTIGINHLSDSNRSGGNFDSVFPILTSLAGPIYGQLGFFLSS